MPNSLKLVSLLEKAYAKLHGSYEALIGGFIDVALNDLTGMCSEQIIMKEGYPGFGENPFTPAKADQQKGDAFWQKLLRYKESGTLMGCSIQPPPVGDKTVATESSAGNGLYFKHAYALVDAGRIKTARNEVVRLVKLRNPWGMGEWTGPWSDTSEERTENQDIIEQFFKILKRKVGGNANKRFFLSINGRGELKVDEIAQEEVVDVNTNDGTFFMSYDAWMQYFTHFFAGIGQYLHFPDEWHGKRVEGCWNETNCGGNTTRSTWVNNPHFDLLLEKRTRLFISLSQEDPRGKENLKIIPIGFHICSLTQSGDKSGKYEMKEPAGKLDPYYRLYKEKDRLDFKKGIRAETLPPAIIPGSVITGFDEDGTPQPAYTFKQAVSADVTMEPGRYCIVPSMYMRTDKDTRKANVGSFWISVYSNTPAFSLEGGEKIVEEEEGDGEFGNNNAPFTPGKNSSANSPGKKSGSAVVSDSASTMEKRRKFEDTKEEFLSQAKVKGVGFRQLKIEFAKSALLKKVDCRRKLASLGFKSDDLTDDKFNILFSGLDATNNGFIYTDAILHLFEREIEEDQMACEIPEIEDDDVPEKLHQDGILEIDLYSAKDLVIQSRHKSSAQQRLQRKVEFPIVCFSSSEVLLRKKIAAEICELNPALSFQLRPFLKRSGFLSASGMATVKRQSEVNRSSGSTSQYKQVPTPIEIFFKMLESMYVSKDRNGREYESYEEQMEFQVRSPVYNKHGDIYSSQGFGSKLEVPTTNNLLLHNSDRMKTLEENRRNRLLSLQKQKHLALGDKQKTSALPRLIGGRKSGSTYVSCIDCGTRVLVGGRKDAMVDTTGASVPTYLCGGSNCTNSFCKPCYTLLPENKKVCEDCFRHELVPIESFGEQLRVILIEKIGISEERRKVLEDIFQSFDTDSSGSLSAGEFSLAIAKLNIQPPLTEEQKQHLLRR
uniref:Uncharacterized protein n=1 Tax=Globisporangium ultimum (strain ATCC 200006 / CBS 805.95 / DAOM BR144) TaxID=431595 RepID=K3WI10_GLOUD